MLSTVQAGGSLIYVVSIAHCHCWLHCHATLLQLLIVVSVSCDVLSSSSPLSFCHCDVLSLLCDFDIICLYRYHSLSFFVFAFSAH